MEIKKHPKTLRRQDTVLLIIDIQEKIIKVIYDYRRVIQNVIKLIKGFKILDIPVFFTEQYPKGLGNTIPELKKELTGDAIEKMTFSCSGAEGLIKKFIDNDIKQVVVCGVESHVCVQQTVLDLLSNGFQVNVAADAVSSRREFDFEFAVQRMRNSGAEITTTESILFELLNICGTPEFKAISKIVK
ncbi:hydrolase [Bacteroidota bacterium]